jgi:adenylate cyclase, class 2
VSQDYEIEVKARVDGLEKVKARLENLGCEFSPPVLQEDTVFVNDEAAITAPSTGMIVIRLRTQGNSVALTLKQYRSNQQDCLEKEVLVGSYAVAADILVLLGYKPCVQLSKSRQTATLGCLTICLDSVTGLGEFIEVEVISSSSNATEVQAELREFLVHVGLTETDFVTEGYHIMAYRTLQPNYRFLPSDHQSPMPSG